MGGTLLKRRLLARVGAAIYAVFLVTAPFEHHDLPCELKTPLHCTACTASVLGSDPQAPAGIGEAILADAGSAIAFQAVTDGVLLVVRSTGRSPPPHI